MYWGQRRLEKVEKDGMSQGTEKLIIGGLGVWAGKSVWEGTEVKRYRVSKVEGHCWG